MSKINWRDFNFVHARTTSSLCSGEERTLTPQEIEEVNKALQTMERLSYEVQAMFKTAKDRFALRMH